MPPRDDEVAPNVHLTPLYGGEMDVHILRRPSVTLSPTPLPNAQREHPRLGVLGS